MIERQIPLKTYLSDDEDRALDEISDMMGMSRTSFCRLALLNYMIESYDQVSIFEGITGRYKKERK